SAAFAAFAFTRSKVMSASRKRQERHRRFFRRPPRATLLAWRGAPPRRRRRGGAAACAPPPPRPARDRAPIAGRATAPAGGGTGAAVERDGEAVRFVADALDEQQRRIVFGQRQRIVFVAGVEQLLFLRDADGDEVGEAELFERAVGGGQLSLAAVDQDQIRKR